MVASCTKYPANQTLFSQQYFLSDSYIFLFSLATDVHAHGCVCFMDSYCTGSHYIWCQLSYMTWYALGGTLHQYFLAPLLSSTINQSCCSLSVKILDDCLFMYTVVVLNSAVFASVLSVILHDMVCPRGCLASIFSGIIHTCDTLCIFDTAFGGNDCIFKVWNCVCADAANIVTSQSAWVLTPLAISYSSIFNFLSFFWVNKNRNLVLLIASSQLCLN